MITDDDLVDAFPGSDMDHVNKELYRARLGRVLVAMRCRACATWHEPPRPVCPHCWSREVRPEPLSGRGHVFALTYSPDGVAAGMAVPTVLVELEEQDGLRLAGPLLAAPAGAVPIDASHVTIGAPVVATWWEHDGVPVVSFRLVQP